VPRGDHCAAVERRPNRGGLSLAHGGGTAFICETDSRSAALADLSLRRESERGRRAPPTDRRRCRRASVGRHATTTAERLLRPAS